MKSTSFHFDILIKTYATVTSTRHVKHVQMAAFSAIVGGGRRAGGCGSTMTAPSKWRTHVTLTKSIFPPPVSGSSDGPRIQHGRLSLSQYDDRQIRAGVLARSWWVSHSCDISELFSHNSLTSNIFFSELSKH